MSFYFQESGGKIIRSREMMRNRLSISAEELAQKYNIAIRDLTDGEYHAMLLIVNTTPVFMTAPSKDRQEVYDYVLDMAQERWREAQEEKLLEQIRAKEREFDNKPLAQRKRK